MARIAEVFVLLNALGGLGTYGARWWFRRRKQSSVEHVRELEQQNKEIDEALERWRTPRRPTPNAPVSSAGFVLAGRAGLRSSPSMTQHWASSFLVVAAAKQHEAQEAR